MASRPDQHRRKRDRQSGRANWPGRRRSAPLRRVPAPANDNRFHMTRTGRIALLTMVVGVVLAVSLYVAL